MSHFNYLGVYFSFNDHLVIVGWRHSETRNSCTITSHSLLFLFCFNLIRVSCVHRTTHGLVTVHYSCHCFFVFLSYFRAHIRSWVGMWPFFWTRWMRRIELIISMSGVNILSLCTSRTFVYVLFIYLISVQRDDESRRLHLRAMTLGRQSNSVLLWRDWRRSWRERAR